MFRCPALKPSRQRLPRAVLSNTRSVTGPQRQTDSEQPTIGDQLAPSASSPTHLRTRFPEAASELRKWRELLTSRRKDWGKEADRRLAEVGARINEISGYREVERLKLLVQEKEASLHTQREIVKMAKLAYDAAVTARDIAQRDVNGLLERKHSWRDEDVARFTSLVRADHASNTAVTTTAEKLRTAESQADKEFSELMQAILQRYHEEQVWSDKIRSASTWASQVGLLVNLVVFVGALVFIEPWKRRKLVEKLDQRISDLMQNVDERISNLSSAIEASSPADLTVPPTTTLDEPPQRDATVDAIDRQTTSGQADEFLLSSSFSALSALPEWAEIIERPSHRRDILAVGGSCIVLGIGLDQLVRLFFR